ncbi:MAG: hypothetical protein AAF960_12410 [Bacteroidota bacterium]
MQKKLTITRNGKEYRFSHIADFYPLVVNLFYFYLFVQYDWLYDSGANRVLV